MAKTLSRKVTIYIDGKPAEACCKLLKKRILTLMINTVSDTIHNTNRETLRLKAKTDFFYYYMFVMPNGKPLYLHVGHYKDSDTLYLYSASIKQPKDMKTLQ